MWMDVCFTLRTATHSVRRFPGTLVYAVPIPSGYIQVS